MCAFKGLGQQQPLLGDLCTVRMERPGAEHPTQSVRQASRVSPSDSGAVQRQRQRFLRSWLRTLQDGVRVCVCVRAYLFCFRFH